MVIKKGRPLPKVFIIVLNWNGYRDTVECLRSLFRLTYPACEIILVDNGSTDDSVSGLKKEFRDLIYIENKENLGFAEGNNVGIRYALGHGADYIFLLNNDTVVKRDLIDILISVAEPDERIGVVGPKIYAGLSESLVLWGAGGEIDWRHGKTYHTGYHEIDHGQWDNIRDVDYVSGCAMLIRKKVLEDVGLLDERFFLYYEETDFCMRARKRGFRVVYAPHARVWHKAFATTGGENGPVYTYYMTRNRLLFMKMYMDETLWRRFIFYFCYEGLLRRGVFLLCKSRCPIKSLKALWSGWRDFQQSRFYRGPEWLHH